MSRKDQRLYGKFTLDFARDEKIAILSDAAFRALVEMILYSREQLSDGVLASRYALATWGPEVIAELCSNDDEKPSLREHPKGWEIHDFADHQDTKAEVEARSERNKRNGQKGGEAKASRAAKRVASESPSQPVAETESETESKEPAKTGSTRAHGRARPQRRQPTFTEMARGEPDPIPDAPPDDQGVRPVAGTTAAELVRAVLPANRYPAAVLTDLRLRVGALLHEGTDPEMVREALRLWDQRDGGPGLLPHLLADAAKSLNPRSEPKRQAPASRKVTAALELAARLAGESTTPDEPPIALEASQ